jgi:hypothetical protein
MHNYQPQLRSQEVIKRVSSVFVKGKEGSKGCLEKPQGRQYPCSHDIMSAGERYGQAKDIVAD